METKPGRITPLLEAWREGRQEALHELMAQAAAELRGLARHYFANEKPDHTLQPTALVNEVFLRLEGRPAVDVEDHRQFFAHAARLMREILVDHARARLAAKRGGGAPKDQLAVHHDLPAEAGVGATTILAIDEALKHLDRIDPRLRETVELRYFGGLTVQDVADAQGVSLSTVERNWRTARRWLARELSKGR